MPKVTKKCEDDLKKFNNNMALDLDDHGPTEAINSLVLQVVQYGFNLLNRTLNNLRKMAFTVSGA